MTVSGAEYAPMFMLHASDSNEGRYRLLDIRKSMQDFEQGDTSVVNRSVYDRMKQGRSDLHRIFGTDEEQHKKTSRFPCWFFNTLVTFDFRHGVDLRTQR